ncbi:hypothetical protein [Variovorax atrisoli]|uniref:hypothetical protein n=1 Tax=Variovorax atrisoli TaxID=3394203 RepID=UPI00036E5A28|nr:hypothetical protein [Variovorax paradoxus]
MDEKSRVSLEQHLCLVCGLNFDTGGILFERRLRQSMQRHTVTGWGLCGEHRRLFEEGFVALIECDPERSGVPADQDHMRPEQASRTGRLAHLKRETLARMTHLTLAPDMPCVFVEPGVIEQLRAMIEPEKD